jgi:hypothetical protein
MPDRYIGEREMRKFLREAYAQDPEKSFLAQIARRACDPAMPRDEKGIPRVHPLWLTIGLAALFAIGVFVFFSLVR